MRVYTHPLNAVTDEAEVRAMVAAARSGWFVTVGADGAPLATLLPVMWRGDVVVLHQARANPQWRQLEPDAPALLICAGPQAYISPTWYTETLPSREVVPTWNYSAVQLTGTVRVREEYEWRRAAVTDLIGVHEADQPHPWALTDADPDYVESEMPGFVGIEFRVTGFTGKAKLSQNKSAADRRGVIAGLRERSGDAEAAAIADAMDETNGK